MMVLLGISNPVIYYNSEACAAYYSSMALRNNPYIIKIYIL